MDILREDLGRIFRIKAYLQKRPILLYTLLLLFGIFTAYHIVDLWHYIPVEDPTQIYMQYRLDVLNQYMQSILEGDLPKIAGWKDLAPAFYLYASYLGVIMGKTDVAQMFLLLQSGAAALVLLLYPTLIYRLTNAILPALASPFLLDTFVGWALYKYKTDIYWSMAWIVVIGLPLLGIFFREKHGWVKWATFVGICLCIGLGNLPRTHSSLGILLLLLACLVKEFVIPLRGKRSRKTVVQACALLVLALVSYTLFTGLILKLYLTETGQNGKIESAGPWHPMYIGLGWEENKYGFQFDDGYAIERVKTIDPSVEYLSHEYTSILKNEWFKLWKEDPGYMLGTYYRKFNACLSLCLKYPALAGFNMRQYLTIFILVASIFRYVCKRRKVWTPWGSLFFGSAICFLCGLVFPMIAVPRPHYIMGSYAAFGMLFVFAVLAIMKGTINVVEDFLRNGSKNFVEK